MKERHLKDFLPMQDRCSNCSYCKFIPLDKIRSARFSQGCPAVSYYGFNAYSARGRFQLGRALNQDEAVASPGFAELAHSCMSCGACDLSCKICRYNLEPLAHNLALKEAALQRGLSLPGQSELLQAFRAGPGGIQRPAWAEGLGLKDAACQPVHTLYFPGCKYALEPGLQATARFGAQLLKGSGVDLGYLQSADFCCGAAPWQMGFREEFEAAAQKNIALLEATGAKRIVTPCADCFHTLNRLYAELGLSIPVIHITQVMDELLAQGALHFHTPVSALAVYQDPCHLGRQGEGHQPWDGKEKKILNQIHTWQPRRPRAMGANGIYDPPRRILQAIPGLQLAEMERTREYSWCCGGGGGCPATLPAYAAATAAQRAQEAQAAGAGLLVTACPGCRLQLGAAAAGSGLEVVDLLDLAFRAL